MHACRNEDFGQAFGWDAGPQQPQARWRTRGRIACGAPSTELTPLWPSVCHVRPCASGTPASPPARGGRRRMIRQKSARMVAHLSEIVLGTTGRAPAHKEFILCVRFDIRHHPRPRRLRARVRGGTRSAHAAFATNCSDDLKGIRGGHVSRPQSLVSPDDTLRSKSRDSGSRSEANASANCPGSKRPARVTHTPHGLSSLVRSEHRLGGPPSHGCGPAFHSWNGACPVPAASGRLPRFACGAVRRATCSHRPRPN